MITRVALQRIRNIVVVSFAVAYVAATAWQVSERRDDWPLSSFPMYSHKQGGWASKNVVLGVTPDGEYPLGPDELGPLRGARLTHLLSKLSSDRKRLRSFLLVLVEQRRKRMPHAPELVGIRVRRQSWRIQQNLKGIDKPKSKLVQTLYLPPEQLQSRLREEELVRAAVLPPIEVEGDIVVDLEEQHCLSGCEPVNDRYAHRGAAVSLESSPTDSAVVELELDIPKGSYQVLVRVRTSAPPGQDGFSVHIDGKPMSKKLGFGHHKSALPANGWVWVSKGMPYPAVRHHERAGGKHTLRIIVDRGDFVIDQLWLSKSQRELPGENRARTP